METEVEMQIAKPVAPEDLAAGDYVSVLQVLHEQLPFLLDEEMFSRPLAPRRVFMLPGCGSPMRVADLCLPYILAELPDGRHRMLDLRRYRIARLSERFGQTAFERMKPKEKESDKKEDGATMADAPPSTDT